MSCASKLPGSLSTICAGSACFASTCLNGYNLISGACSKIDTTSDVNNCGFLGRPCTFLPTGATGGECLLAASDVECLCVLTRSVLSFNSMREQCLQDYGLPHPGICPLQRRVYRSGSLAARSREEVQSRRANSLSRRRASVSDLEQRVSLFLVRAVSRHRADSLLRSAHSKWPSRTTSPHRSTRFLESWAEPAATNASTLPKLSSRVAGVHPPARDRTVPRSRVLAESAAIRACAASSPAWLGHVPTSQGQSVLLLAVIGTAGGITLDELLAGATSLPHMDMALSTNLVSPDL